VRTLSIALLSVTLLSLTPAEGSSVLAKVCSRRHAQVEAIQRADRTEGNVYKHDVDETFHFTAINSNGTLKIGYLTATTAGKSSIDVAADIKAAMYLWGDKVDRIEVTFASDSPLDDGGHVRTHDPLLDDFNRAWMLKRGKMQLWNREASPAQLRELTQTAAYNTDIGNVVMDKRYGFSEPTIESSLGQEGKWVSVSLVFRRKPKPR
jgi:hypothetical protein